MNSFWGTSKNAGFAEAAIVTAEGDSSINETFSDRFGSLSLSYFAQTVPRGREKPAGTADALLQVLRVRPGWAGGSCAVCNGDNIYSVNVLNTLRKAPSDNAMPCYRRDGLHYPEDRTQRFAVVSVTEDFSVKGIIEKPTSSEIEMNKVNGRVFVSMNLFKLDYSMVLPFLENVPFSPGRDEKELPVAIGMMIRKNPGCILGIPVCEHIPDLTSAVDIDRVSDELQLLSSRPFYEQGQQL